MKTRSRLWLWYALAWIPLALFYSVLVAAHPAIVRRERAGSGTTYVAPVALLGVAIWWLSGVVEWPPRNVARFVAIHVAAMVSFALIWLGVEISHIASSTGYRVAWEITRQFAGFQALDGTFFYGLIAAGSYVIRIASRLREQEARAAHADALRMRAELAALRGQLNPHFLFNTLHTLTALVRRDPDTAEHALERFGDMLRYVLDVKRSAREDVTLGDEMQFVRNYLSLEQLRLGDRLRVVERLDPEALDCVLPSLTLQPLVENAIKYGIAPRARGGSIEMAARFEDEALVLEVRDDGAGAQTNIDVDAAAGMGLRAVRSVSRPAIGRDAEFSVTTAPREGFIVRASILRTSARSLLPVPSPAIATRPKARRFAHEDASCHRRRRADRARPAARPGGRDRLDQVRRRGGGRAARQSACRSSPPPRLVFLDIEMPELRMGSASCGASRTTPAIVFTTAYDKFAVAAFELEAIDYLLKPFGRDRSLRGAGSREARGARRRRHTDVTSRTRGDRTSATIGSRLRARSRSRLCRSPLPTSNGSRPTTTMSRSHPWPAIPRLPRDERVRGASSTAIASLRIHRSHIVNLDHVAAIAPSMPFACVSRSKADQLVAESHAVTELRRWRSDSASSSCLLPPISRAFSPRTIRAPATSCSTSFGFPASARARSTTPTRRARPSWLAESLRGVGYGRDDSCDERPPDRRRRVARSAGPARRRARLRPLRRAARRAAGAVGQPALRADGA